MIIRWRYIFCICPYNKSALKWAGVYLSWLNSWWVQMFLFLWVRSKVQIHCIALKYCLVRSSEAHSNYLLASVTMCYLPSCCGISRHHAGDKDTSVSKMRQTHLALYLVCLFLFSQEFPGCWKWEETENQETCIGFQVFRGECGAEKRLRAVCVFLK